MAEHIYGSGQRIWMIPRESAVDMGPREYEIMYSGTIHNQLSDGRYHVQMDSGRWILLGEQDMLPKPEAAEYNPVDHTMIVLGAIIAVALFGAWLLG